jgi:type IV secretion system protein VirD4
MNGGRSYQHGSSSSTNVSESARPLLTPDEVMNLPPDHCVGFFKGLRPVLFEKIRYYQDRLFNWRFSLWG